MSADDFQTKYASFMESIVKGSIAETTKLFETMVDELKAELSKVKMENEALKTTRRGNQNGETSSISESCQSEAPGVRDTAVQCDLLPAPPLLGTLDPPTGQSTVYHQEQCHQEEMDFTLLLDHDDDDDANKGHSLLKKAEVFNPTVVGEEVWCSVADSATDETEDPELEQQCSSAVPRRSDESLANTLHDCNSRETCTQSVESLAVTSNETEAESGAHAFRMEGCARPTTLAAALVQTLQPPSGETAGSERACVIVQQCSGLPLPQQQQVNVTAKKARKEQKEPSINLQKIRRKSRVLGHDEAKSFVPDGEVGTSSCGLAEMCLRSSASKDTSSLLKTTLPPGSRKRRISTLDVDASSKNSPRNEPHRDRSAHKKTQDVDASSKRSPRNEPHRDGPTHKRTQTSRTRLPGDDADSKTLRLLSVSHNDATMVRVGASSKRPGSQPFSSSNFAEDEPAPKHIITPSQSLLGDSAPPATHWVKLPQIADQTRETTAKKSRLHPNLSISENVKLRNAQKLAKMGAKISKPNQSKLNERNCASDETGKKFTSQAVSPKVPARKAASLRRTRSSFSPVQKEALSPRSQNHTVVFHPSLSQLPPIGSLLQPLPVTDGPLLKNQCGECGRVLSSSAALESHLSLHKGHRPFSCTVCRKSFPDAKGLRRHDRVHRHGRIHTCHQCGKGFVYVYGLTKHLQMVHVKFKPFVCQICNKAFFTKGDVEDHIRLHTGEKPFHCHLCEKRFVKKVELKMHLKWHNGEKRHWCPYCGKGFFDYNNWKRHKYIHTGEKPHSCPHCPKHFKQSSHLKKHVRNVHKIQ